MGLMAQQHQQPSLQAKEEPYDHHNQHTPQGQVQNIQQHSRPPSVVHQQPSHPPPQPQQPSYSSVYQPPQQSSGQHPQDIYNYPSSQYNAPATNSGYTSAEMMAATMSRPPYPPMPYHTPQSNSPASVGSASGHDQQRSMYGQPPMHQQQMYYGQHQQYHQQLPPAAPSPYGQHTHPSHQSMGSQPSMMMSHGAPSPVPHQMAQHPGQHSPAPGMNGSPRHTKIEVPQLSRQAPPSAPSPLSMGQVQPNMQPQGMHQGLQSHQTHQPQSMHQPPPHQQHPQHPQHQQHQQHQHIQHQHQQHPQQSAPQHAQHPQHPQQHSAHTPQNGTSPLPSGQTGSAGSSVVNANAAPGPIPATTPLVVRQDQNGVQWIAFEYSRDRVKMEYTIRCDVESVQTDELSAEFKQDNCVYPRACCPREQYRGNRLQYESECNTVGWALAQLNPPLRGKRGLIQRAVDSWRNSNQDPRLRSRRVRRMAKMGSRKAANVANSSGMAAGIGQPSPAHMGPSATLPSVGTPMGKPLHGIPQMHHHTDATAQAGGEEVGMFHQM
ncbi:ribosomal protein l24e [Ophiostoma piceae UAMH 11346]|uniref:Ribosomal protein l24e n=1 Tax=Ophiostoma piceae (strain UAMH 11346) TaxID=1262450 RepID=S3CV51_OPHP1|nr:ribosomal protein l24e [Ophiostoma piceae UAMH 11346]